MKKYGARIQSILEFTTLLVIVVVGNILGNFYYLRIDLTEEKRYTHIMQEVEAMCNRVILINKGKIIADDTLEGLKNTAPSDSLETIFRNLTSHVGSI